MSIEQDVPPCIKQVKAKTKTIYDPSDMGSPGFQDPDQMAREQRFLANEKNELAKESERARQDFKALKPLALKPESYNDDQYQMGNKTYLLQYSGDTNNQYNLRITEWPKKDGKVDKDGKAEKSTLYLLDDSGVPMIISRSRKINGGCTEISQTNYIGSGDVADARESFKEYIKATKQGEKLVNN